MSFLLLLLVSALLFGGAYRFYGRWLSRRFELNDHHVVPSKAQEDGVDFVPTRFFVLLGHHFSSIAGAGPIVGPVIAALYFGWLPALLWILLGSILVGGVQDFGSVMASIRHKAASIAEVARTYMSGFAGRLFMLFIWLTLVYVIVVFLDLTASTFVHSGEVASSSLLFILLAIGLGFVMTRSRLGLGRTLLIFLPLLAFTIYLGQIIPINEVPALWGQQKFTWDIILLVYCFVASVAPVWLLLQPRDFLTSFLLYFVVLGGTLGLIIGALGGGLQFNWPAWVAPSEIEAFGIPHLGPLFPILFVTIACGACSGFHSVVASGTTARQVRCESDARRVGYGAMLIEGFVAVIALATVIVLPFSAEPLRQNPVPVFASGMGQFFGSFGIPAALGAQFASLALSTFLLTTLDTCTRLNRFILQEFLGWRNQVAWHRYTATLITVAAPACFVFMTITGPDGTPVPVWRAIWNIFGATNQLLGALALLAVTIWLKRAGRPWLFAAIPMLFMLVMTMTALVTIFFQQQDRTNAISAIAVALFALGLMIVWEAWRAFRAPPLFRETLQTGEAVARS